MRPVNRYKIKTPDYSFNNKYHELKVLNSAQVRQLLVLLDEAKEQATNIIIDIRKTKITEQRVKEVCTEFMRAHKKYRVSLIISATKVLDIKIWLAIMQV